MAARSRPELSAPKWMSRPKGAIVKYVGMAQGSPEPAIRATGLTKIFGRVRALDDCNLEVPRGRFMALVGPNGAGKTTLLNLMVGLLAPTKGDVSIYGLDPQRRRRDVLALVGFVGQDRPLYRSLTVRDTLEMGRRFSRTWDQQAAASRPERLGIPLDQQVGKLSGGQQAQVSLTLALSKHPDLLILDEPLASLDPVARQEFLDEVVAAAADQPLTVIMSSHIVAELGRVCDYLTILQQGRLLVSGPVSDILASAKARDDAESEATRSWTDLERVVMSYLARPR